MPAKRLVLLILAVLVAAAATVAIGLFVAPMLGPGGPVAAVSLLILFFLLARLAIGRAGRR